jgi:hypothetical protein
MQPPAHRRLQQRRSSLRVPVGAKVVPKILVWGQSLVLGPNPLRRIWPVRPQFQWGNGPKLLWMGPKCQWRLWRNLVRA